MKKILFPTDFSEAANHAFIYALRIAKKLKAEIITLHVYERPDVKALHLPHTLAEVYESIDLETFEDFRDAVPALHKIAEANGLSGVNFSNAIQEGEIVPTIIRFARKNDVDMIIMGTKGAGWLKEIFIGSVAGEVLENAPCPVLAIPTDAHFDGRIDKIAITTNFEESEKIALLKLVDWATAFDARVYCVHVDTSHTENLTHKMDALRQEFAGVKNLQFINLDDTDLMKALSEFVEKERIDMLAMLTRKRGFFEELLHYSKVKSMSYHTNIPILSIQTHLL
ncbi:MAG TPA: universal stress protein [Saprospiraceae bacterium]|nr:universal stress protein [Saprospiraceae bacterium]